jgi:hypothetical protein
MPTMKSMAAYYAFLAMNGQDEDLYRRRAPQTAPRPAGPSPFARVRAFVGSRRATAPAAHSA